MTEHTMRSSNALWLWELQYAGSEVLFGVKHVIGGTDLHIETFTRMAWVKQPKED